MSEAAADRTFRVLIADDHRVVREGLALLIGLQSSFEVVAQASDGLAAVELAAKHRPHIAVVDLALPGLDGIAVTRRLKGDLPATAVIVMTGSLGLEAVRAALDGGADGYVPKDSDSTEFLRALHCVAQGGQYVSTGVAGAAAAATSQGDPELTVREREIAALVAAGRANKEIASRLALSVGTVRKHRENIMRKLALRNTAELTAYVIRQGWSAGG